MNNQKIAALYTRVSTEEQQKGYSLEAQKDALSEYANREGYKVYDIYEDRGFSGKDFNRPEIQRMLIDLNRNCFDTILVWKVDRLSRNNSDVLNLIDQELLPKSKKLVITSINMDSTTSLGRMFISLLGTFASYERATIIDRVNSGMKKRAEKGCWNGGIVLGYDTSNKKLVINEEESKIVKEIFELRANQNGYKAIANKLNSKGLKTKKGKNFSISGIKLILSNPVYIGKLVWGKHKEWSLKRRNGKSEPITEQGEHQPIISLELWDKVQKINEYQKQAYSTNRNFNGNFLLTGLLKCPKCGAGTVMSKSKKYKGGYYYYYMCQSFHSKGKTVCSSNLINKDMVEAKVINFIKEIVNDENIIVGILDELKKENVLPNKALLDDLQVYQKKLSNTITKQEKLDEDYFANKINAVAYNRLVSSLQKEIELIKSNINELKVKLDSVGINLTKDEVITALQNFEHLFKIADNQEKKHLIRALIKEVHMEENRKDIKKITFWFSSVDVLRPNKVRRTVS
ncbi:recombinase family protein [Halalkalibacter oceani]|uniref:recombinase family protein n=1 Tax=Halalkalibacter oceani TaxID=1653776 RepID=UPI00339368BC